MTLNNIQDKRIFLLKFGINRSIFNDVDIEIINNKSVRYDEKYYLLPVTSTIQKLKWKMKNILCPVKYFSSYFR